VSSVQRCVKQENLVRYIVYRHVSAIRVMYHVFIVLSVVHIVHRATDSVNSVSIQLPVAARVLNKTQCLCTAEPHYCVQNSLLCDCHRPTH
jgi:hypothetical protein